MHGICLAIAMPDVQFLNANPITKIQKFSLLSKLHRGRLDALKAAKATS